MSQKHHRGPERERFWRVGGRRLEEVRPDDCCVLRGPGNQPSQFLCLAAQIRPT